MNDMKKVLIVAISVVLVIAIAAGVSIGVMANTMNGLKDRVEELDQAYASDKAAMMAEIEAAKAANENLVTAADFEAKLAAAIGEQNQTMQSLISTAVKNQIEELGTEGLTEAQVQEIIDAAVANCLTEADIDAIIADANTGLTKDEVKKIVADYTAGTLTYGQIVNLIEDETYALRKYLENYINDLGEEIQENHTSALTIYATDAVDGVYTLDKEQLNKVISNGTISLSGNWANVSLVIDYDAEKTITLHLNNRVIKSIDIDAPKMTLTVRGSAAINLATVGDLIVTDVKTIFVYYVNADMMNFNGGNTCSVYDVTVDTINFNVGTRLNVYREATHVNTINVNGGSELDVYNKAVIDTINLNDFYVLWTESEAVVNTINVKDKGGLVYIWTDVQEVYAYSVGATSAENNTVINTEGNGTIGTYVDYANGFTATLGKNATVSNDISVKVTTLAELEAALENGGYIVFGADITGDVKITQKDGVNLVVDGNDYKFTGVMTVFGDGRQKGEETLTIKNINFIAVNGANSCIVSPSNAVYSKYSYAHNVTIDNCTFTDPNADVDCAAIRSTKAGDINWTITDCTVDSTMHSLLWASNINGMLTIENCVVNSKNGMTTTNTSNIKIDGCEFDTKGLAVRFGADGNVNANEVNFEIANSTLKSACEDGDAVIIFRDSATFATLILDNTTIVGTTKISGNTDATKIIEK